jgi:hypothetical protein
MTCLAWQPEKESRFTLLFKRTRTEGETYSDWIDRMFSTYTEDELKAMIDSQ